MTAPDHTFFMQKAIDVSKQSVVTDRFRVGCVIVDVENNIISTGYTGEGNPLNHAEEIAIQKANDQSISLSNVRLYCTMEPCSKRASRSITCCDIIIEHKIKSVIYAYREPPVFVTCDGHGTLERNGVEIIEITKFANEVKRINQNLI